MSRARSLARSLADELDGDVHRRRRRNSTFYRIQSGLTRIDVSRMRRGNSRHFVYIRMTGTSLSLTPLSCDRVRDSPRTTISLVPTSRRSPRAYRANFSPAHQRGRRGADPTLPSRISVRNPASSLSLFSWCIAFSICRASGYDLVGFPTYLSSDSVRLANKTVI